MNEEPILRIEARFKNARLYNAIVDHRIVVSDDTRIAAVQASGPVAGFCRFYGLSREGVYRLLRMKDAPMVKDRWGRHQVRALCEQLAVILDHTLEDLFPADLYSVTWPRLATELSRREMVPLAEAIGATVLELPAQQEATIAHAELCTALERAVTTLTPREQDIIRRRFGLGIGGVDADEETLEAIARDYKLSRDRIWQIEEKALRKLRKPRRSRTLASFL